MTYAQARDVVAEYQAEFDGNEMVAHEIVADLERLWPPRRVRRQPAYQGQRLHATEMVDAMWEARPLNPLSVGGPGDFVDELIPDRINPALDAFLGLEWVVACAFDLAEAAARIRRLNRAQRRAVAFGRIWRSTKPDHSRLTDLVDDTGPPGRLASVSPFAAHAPPVSIAALGELAQAA